MAGTVLDRVVSGAEVRRTSRPELRRVEDRRLDDGRSGTQARVRGRAIQDTAERIDRAAYQRLDADGPDGVTPLTSKHHVEGGRPIGGMLNTHAGLEDRVRLNRVSGVGQRSFDIANPTSRPEGGAILDRHSS
jgi:hypothetical protein